MQFRSFKTNVYSHLITSKNSSIDWLDSTDPEISSKYLATYTWFFCDQWALHKH